MKAKELRTLTRAELEQRLREAMHRPRTRRPTKPTRASRERRLRSKRRRGETKKQRRPPSRED